MLALRQRTVATSAASATMHRRMINVGAISSMQAVPMALRGLGAPSSGSSTTLHAAALRSQQQQSRGILSLASSRSAWSAAGATGPSSRTSSKTLPIGTPSSAAAIHQLAASILVLHRDRSTRGAAAAAAAQRRYASTEAGEPLKEKGAAAVGSGSLDDGLVKAAPSKLAAATTTTKASSSSSSKEIADAADTGPKKPFMTRAWTVVKREAAHYWAGTKLLGKEIAISAKITKKVLNGGTLTRRERRQLRRTTTDLLRLIPFSVFVLVPFMEILLPVALRLFPNMLPSTFEGKLAADEKQRKLLRVRIEMAKFLQETISESGLKAQGVVDSQEFKEFFRKVRSTGESASPEDVIRVAKRFQDDITLDNLSRPQLVSMCRYMNINAFGTDNFLKHQIRNRLERIRVDDMMIHGEGIESLSTKELQHACQSRGIRFSGVSPSRLREELEQWIELHYTNRISGVLLVLSRAFHFDQTGDSVFKSLEATLSSLPDNLLNEAELDVSGETSTYKQKLEVLQQQQELIEDEAEQEQEEEEARRERKAKEERSRREEEARKARELLPADELENQPSAAGAETSGAAVSASASTASAAADARMTKEQLGELAEALSILSAKSSIVKERDELQRIMEDNLSSEEESKLHPEESDSPQVSLNKRIRRMIKQIDSQLETYDSRVGSSLNTIQCNSKGQISLQDLKSALRVIKHRPDDAIIDAVVEKLDVDRDGFVVLDHVVELTQDIGLGIVVDDDAKGILKKGAQIKEDKPKREDIISD